MAKILNELDVGDKAKVVGFHENSVSYRKKLLAMGLTTGTEFTLTRKAPLGDPIEISVRGYALTLRANEAEILKVEKVKDLEIGIIGNPNSGKTTLFNVLTGSRQRVGNWPGVTVDRKSGFFASDNFQVEVVDLPGIYSLSVNSAEGAIDARIASEYMIANEADLIVNVLDANNLERNLYLTTQLLELNIPIVLAVNMVDIAKKRGITIDIEKLSKAVNCPAVSVVSSKGKGIDTLKSKIISTYNEHKQHNKRVVYPQPIATAITAIAAKIKQPQNYFLAVRLLEDDVLAQQHAKDLTTVVTLHKQQIKARLTEDVDILIADARYNMIHKLVMQIVTESVHVKQTITAAIDRIVLNRILGIPIFLAVIYLMFVFAIGIGVHLQGLFQTGSNAVFFHGLGRVLTIWHTPNWLISILTAGIGKGINTTITFIPILTTIFLFLAILESSGYMARAGFIVDRFMTAIGLPGKSFVPMLVGFGCNVPAIMAARTLEHKRDRILTVLMTPFMSCGARFAIYAVFTAAFFPSNGHNIVFALYLIGILIAVLTGLILRKTVLRGQQSALIMELPPYHIPTIRNIWQQTWCRLKIFITKAGKVIIPVCLLLSVLNTIHINKHSVLETTGKTITPILKPIGIQQNNWPATVGLITGVVAKEVVIGSLNTLYAQDNVTNTKNDIYGQMYTRFSGQAGAFAYLLFVLLYFPCIPAIVTIFRELGWRWATFSMLWNTGVAYGAATVFYQVATFSTNPIYAITSIATVVISFLITILTMRKLNLKEN